MVQRLMNVEQAAQYLGGISKWTVHAWLSKGKLRRTKVGSRTMVSESDLQDFIASCNPKSPKTEPKDIPGDVVGRTVVRDVNRHAFEVESIKSDSKQRPGTGLPGGPPESPNQQELFPTRAIAKPDAFDEAVRRREMRSTDSLSTEKLPKSRPTGRNAEDRKPQVRGSGK